MRVFVAGASGVIGRRLVPMLVEAGHDVTGMTRRVEGAEMLRQLGCEPAICDVFDAAALESTLRDAAPDVVIHELTDLPASLNSRDVDSMTAGNDRIRSVGTKNLVAAALAAGARRIVAQSIAFAYPPSGDGLKSEDGPLYDGAPFPWSRSVAALHDLERAVTGTRGIEGTALRYGFFYGPASAYAHDGYFGRETLRRRLPLIGRAAGVFSFIHVDDAAAATIAALEGGTVGAVYNIVDDDPAPASEWVPEYARALGAKPPRRIPRWLAKLVAGPYAVMMMTELRGASNERAKRELDWAPRYESWRDGFSEALG